MSGRDEKIPQVKLSIVQYVVLAVFLVLAFGLWSLQVRRSGEYESRAQQNRIRRVPILAPRGKILDREGRVLVDNYPSFSALLLRDQLRDLEADAPRIAEGLQIPAEDIRDKVRKLKLAHTPAFQPIIIKDDITPDDRAFIESHQDEYPELETIMVYRRLYPKDGFLAHVIGYVGEVSEDMLNSSKYELYERGNIVGQSGVEQYYNDLLMGKDGSRRVLVDSKGREMGRLSQDAATLGKQLNLTIDLDIQIAAEQALEGRNGAIVAMDPRTGEILAMVSRPVFNPNDFAVRISKGDWKRLSTDPAHPLLNKAIQAQLAPGSVFKIVMSVAGFQEGIAQNLRVNCGGGGVFYGRFFKCWVVAEHRVHGVVDISKGIYQSCDVFFYTLAERLGIERIAKWAMALGLGKKTGIDLPNESSGVMPSEEWKIRNYREKWYAGETISVGIGQGAVTTTPIQLARAIGAISMGGMMVRPHLVASSQLPPQYQAAGDTPEKVRVPIDPQAWITITDAMAGVVNPGGTAPSAHLQGVDFAGKTGSAQVISNALRKSKGAAGKDFKDNGWFVGVTPRRNPEIVVAVLIEQGEHGYLAARTASQVIKAYVDKQRLMHNNPTLFSDKADPGSVPMAGLWNHPMGEDGQESGSQSSEVGATRSEATRSEASGAESAEDRLQGDRLQNDRLHDDRLHDDHLQGGTLLLKMGRAGQAGGGRSAPSKARAGGG